MGKRSAEVSADVLDAICDSAVDPSAWARLPTVLAHIAKAQACAIYYDTGAAVGDLAAYNLEEYRPDSVACCQRLDPWPKLGWAAAGLTGKFDEQIFRQSDLKTPIYFPHCTRYFWLCCLLSVNAPLSQDLYFKIGLHRPRGAKPFSPEVKAKLDLLLPHIQRALQVRLRAMDSERQATIGFAGLSALSFAVVICHGNAVVDFANAAAEQMGATGSSLNFARRTEVATLQLAARTQELHSLIRNAASGGAGDATRFDHPGETLLMLVAPLPSHIHLSATSDSRVMVSIKGTAHDHRFSKARLPALFDFTATESELAVALMSSKSIEEIATERGVKIPTLRTQLRSMFAKTGTENQRHLVRLLGTIPQMEDEG